MMLLNACVSVFLHACEIDEINICILCWVFGFTWLRHFKSALPRRRVLFPNLSAGKYDVALCMWMNVSWYRNYVIVCE